MSEPPTVGRTKPVRQLPEPSRFWIAYTPRSWRSAAAPWTDLAAAALGGLQGPMASPLPDLDPEEVDDLLYLPPVSAELGGERDRLVAGLVESGTPVLVQLAPGEPAVAGAALVYDLLAPLLARSVDALAALPPGATAVWPLVAGLTDAVELWDEGCRRLAAAGARVVQPLLLELTPFERRRLAEGRDEGVYDALFHAEPPVERDFSRLAYQHGLAPFMARPETGRSRRQRSNRKIAAHLAMAGELWLRLGRGEAAGQAYFRAARGAENTRHDLSALAREENLGVMEWLDQAAVQLVKELMAHGRSTLVERLYDAYLDGAPGAATP